MPGRAYQFRRAVAKADLAQRICALRRTAEPTTGRRRKRSLRITMPRDRVEQQLPGNVLVQTGPKAESDTAAAAQHPMRLTQRQRWSGHMVDAEVRDHCIKFAVRVGQRLGVALIEVYCLDVRSGDGEHRGREIEPGCARAA